MEQQLKKENEKAYIAKKTKPKTCCTATKSEEMVVLLRFIYHVLIMIFIYYLFNEKHRITGT